MKLNAALGRDRDVAITAHETLAGAAGGTAADFEMPLWIVPDVTRAFAPQLIRGNVNGVALSALPRNEVAVRSAQIVGNAAITANATNSAELRINLWRGGVLQGALASFNTVAATTITPAVVASAASQTVAVASGAGLRPGQSVVVDTGASQEIVVLTAATATSVSAVFTKAHSAGAALAASVLAFAPALFAPAWHGVAAGATIPAVGATGSQTITPNAVNGNSGMLGIHVGDKITVTDGANTETVTVSAVTATTFTATFANTHGAGVAINTAASGLNQGISGTDQALIGNDVLTLARISSNVTGVATQNISLTLDLTLAVSPLGA